MKATTQKQSPRPLGVHTISDIYHPDVQAGLEAQFARWHEIASAAAGLSSLDRKILDVICAFYHRLHAEGFAGGLSVDRIAVKTGADPRSIRSSIKRLTSR